MRLLAQIKPERGALAVALFFGLKICSGVVLLALSARWLPVTGFAAFSQSMILLAFMTTLATAGVQQGLIRETAASDGQGIGAVVRAALAIWAVVGLGMVAITSLLSARISILLIGSTALSWSIPWLSGLAVVAGLGQLGCSILAGTRRTTRGVAAQAAGLALSSALAIWLFHEGDGVTAALGFAVGPVLTTVISLLSLDRTRLLAAPAESTIRREIRQLLGYSLAFLAMASIMPLTLLGLRSAYQSAAGVMALGYWLAANRISDVNTQLLGLYMVQVFLPAMARLKDRTGAWALTLRTFAIGSLAMGSGLLLFMVAPAFLISLFLSVKFLPAAAIITGYFVGDALRVSSSLASYTVLSQRRLKAYVAFEAGTAALFAAALLVLIRLGVPNAPAFAYPGAYAGMALVAWRLLRTFVRNGAPRAGQLPAGSIVQIEEEKR